MVLFIAGDGVNSRSARDNIRAIHENERKDTPAEGEVVDVRKDYCQALEIGVPITPGLFVLSPRPRLRISGSLEDAPHVLSTIRLASQALSM
jgi:circadian clock protein KaiB